VPERWVVDASPLIALGSIGRLTLLTSLADEVVVPEAVAHEVLQVADEAAHAFSGSSIRRVTVKIDDLVRNWGLGPGETAVLSFANQTSGFVAILDDLAARRCAHALGIHVRGTLGITLLAKARGKLASVGRVLDELRDAGFHLSPELVAAALSSAGERD